MYNKYLRSMPYLFFATQIELKIQDVVHIFSIVAYSD
ncbi:unnamed protein product [Paramecium sonneborni]|uniref:Uncharacterized protein n=1 Tax=Paramecium sonneborni TaxID=65129 RepID=A0A8S1N6W9_9CILI|nr:unnamed protein product [Paramecium sonneborni]